MVVHPDTFRARLALVLGLGPLAACGSPDTECLALPADGTCPSEAEASEQLVGGQCGYTVNAVTGEGEVTTVHNPWDTGSTEACCYPTLETEDLVVTCLVGRPFLDAGQPVVADLAPGPGWSRGPAPRVATLTPAERAVLAEAWAADARVEHASVAAFARTTLELMRVGAPAELLAAVQAAAADEVRHAELSFALASAYAGVPVGPGAFPLGPALPLRTDLADIAAATFREGCVGETVVALLSARAAEGADDRACRALLSRVARDEARHAELAWRTLAWALDAGGEAVARAVANEVEHLLRDGVALTQVTTGAPDDVLRAHGRIRPAEADAARRAAVYEVVLPCVRALLARQRAAA